ncbi:glycosyltransferase [Caenimonas koreensis]|uniref:Glycosyltransferase n=1 Tax=Caenimonas koreensis DSM 17982 TaxID=1121255 RepID=A0A844BAZ0_9BURK|nr:glycosyltransferase [Caenimonas koreensis]MRD48617.1 glycosyltransferase [Caenimonas koreensis DSM 17982]
MTVDPAAAQRVLVTVVVYQPGAELLEHLRVLRAQCADVLVIDNASATAADIAAAVQASGCRLLHNEVNLGISGALAQAARIAKAEGFHWLLTFDQDSLCPPGAIDALLTLAREHPESERIGLVALGSRDRVTGREYHHRLDILRETAQWRELRSVITSGSMVRIEALQDSPFDERLFIDAVDHALCLTLRRHGWLVIESASHELQHSIGHATMHKLFGRTVVCTHHSPSRIYYRNRNHLEVCVRNLLFDPVWALKGMAQVLSNDMTVLILEEDKVAKLRAMLGGLRDFLFRRFGPLPPSGLGRR